MRNKSADICCIDKFRRIGENMAVRNFCLMLLFCFQAVALAQLQRLPEPLFYFPFNEGKFEALRGLGLEQPLRVHHQEYIKWVEGPTGKTLYFENDGEEQKRGMISCQLPPSFDVQSAFSIVAFVKTPPSLHRSRQYEIVNFIDHTSKGPGFRLLISWRRLWFYLGDGEQLCRPSSNSFELSINPQQWYHVAAVYDGQGSARVYVNGLLQGSCDGVQVKMPIIRKLEMRIGASADQRSGYGFEGCISGLRIYDLALNAEQIAALSQLE